MTKDDILELLGDSDPRKVRVSNEIEVRVWRGNLYVIKNDEECIPTNKELEDILSFLINNKTPHRCPKISEEEEEDCILFAYNVPGSDIENPHGEDWDKKFMQLIGDDKTDPRVTFIGDKRIINEESAISRIYTYGVYTYKGHTYLLYLGIDSPINLFSDYELSKIYENLKKGRFMISPTYQG